MYTNTLMYFNAECIKKEMNLIKKKISIDFLYDDWMLCNNSLFNIKKKI